MRREMSRTDEPDLARQAVLERFGDPKRLAARLWFDAMKETVMKDRILIGTVALLAIVCIAVCAMMWLSLQQSQKVNQELLSALTDLRQTSARPAASTERTELAIRVVAETEQGPPVAGATIALVGAAMNPTQSMTLERTTNGDGIAVFPPVLPGVYSLAIRTAGLHMGKSIVVTPGPERRTETFVSPTPLSEASIAVDVEWPDQFPKDGFFLRCEFRPVQSDVVHQGVDWTVRRPLDLYLGDSARVDRLEQLLRRRSRAMGWPTPTVRPLKHADVGKLRVGTYILRTISVLRLNADLSSRRNQALFKPFHRHDYGQDAPGPLFEAGPDAVNRWSIPLSERLVKDVLTQLGAADPTQPLRPPAPSD